VLLSARCLRSWKCGYDHTPQRGSVRTYRACLFFCLWVCNDLQVMQQLHSGPLRINVRRAADLHNTQLIGKQDPYVLLSLSKRTCKTAVHTKGHKTPVWDQQMTFDLQGTLEETYGMPYLHVLENQGR